jgi:hypothetical protein
MFRRIPVLLAAASVVVSAVALAARAADPPPANEIFAQISKEFDAAQAAFMEEYRAAKDDAARAKLVEEKYPRPSKYAPRVVAFVDRNPDDPAAVDALVWLATRADGPDALKPALERLSRHHLKSEKIGPVCQRLGYNTDASAQAFLAKVMEGSPHRDVRGTACFAMGQSLLNANKGPEAEKRFEEVVEKYADVQGGRGTLGESAKSQLFEARNLVTGKVAPEIEGEDVEGVRFKLSDYRGKVVVLDFWGDW